MANIAFLCRALTLTFALNRVYPYTGRMTDQVVVRHRRPARHPPQIIPKASLESPDGFCHIYVHLLVDLVFPATTPAAAAEEAEAARPQGQAEHDGAEEAPKIKLAGRRICLYNADPLLFRVKDQILSRQHGVAEQPGRLAKRIAGLEGESVNARAAGW